MVKGLVNGSHQPTEDACSHLFAVLGGHHVLVHVDTSTVFNLNHQGGTWFGELVAAHSEYPQLVTSTVCVTESSLSAKGS